MLLPCLFFMRSCLYPIMLVLLFLSSSTIVVVSFSSVLITLALSLLIQFKVSFYIVFVAGTLARYVF